MNRKSVSLRKSAFIRLLVITLLVVFAFYGIGLYINYAGIQNVRNEMQKSKEADARYIAEDLNRNIASLRFFATEIQSSKDLLSYTLLYDRLSDYKRIEYFNSIVSVEYEIKRFTPLAEYIEIMLPQQKRSIVSEQAAFIDLNET